MVKIEYIKSVFDYVYDAKCLSRARIQEKLSYYTDGQIRDTLYLEDKMNPFELEEYDYLKAVARELPSYLESMRVQGYKEGDKLYDVRVRQLEETEEKIFKYERRIFEDYSPKVYDVPVVDMSRFHTDNADESTTGKIELEQINLQDSIDFTDAQMSSLHEWFSSGYVMINSSIYNGSSWSNLSVGEREGKASHLNMVKRKLTESINKTEGLQQDTILYMGTHTIDASITLGQHINFKGYCSMSFNRESASNFAHDGGYMYILLTPKGTKGICGNAEEMSHHINEHEYLTGRNTGGDIVDIDYDAHEIYVLVDEP